MIQISNAHLGAYAKETIVEKFGWLDLEDQGRWERQFADELRDSMEQKDFANIVMCIVNWAGSDLHGSLDRAWEDFLVRTEPDWKPKALERFAEHHDWLEDDREVPPVRSIMAMHDRFVSDLKEDRDATDRFDGRDYNDQEQSR